MFKRRIYLDYASLTPIDRRVIREMEQYSMPKYANPSSLYAEGVAAKKALADARTSVAHFIQAHADEIVFTSGGSEANALALEGVFRAAVASGMKNQHIIISAIEHSSVREVAAMMEKHGVRVTRLPVDSCGVVSPDELKRAITPETVLVSIMTVNNEIGSIQPIREMAKVIRQVRTDMQKQGTIASDLQYPLFHTDAAQAALYQSLAVDTLGVDLLTLDGSKVYGPRGIGCLYVRRGTPIEPLIYGGGQERGLRSGTENLPAIKGFATALDIAAVDRVTETDRLNRLRGYFIAGLEKIEPRIRVNGSMLNDAMVKEIFSPHILNISIPGIDNEFFLFQLDAAGIACSTKSSCLRDEDESYVLKALGVTTENNKTSLRFSFGRWTTKRDVTCVLRVIRSLLTK